MLDPSPNRPPAKDPANAVATTFRPPCWR